MKITAIFLLLTYLFFNSLAVPHNSYDRSRRDYSNSSMHEYPENVNKTNITAATHVGVIDACNGSITVDSVKGRIRTSSENIVKTIRTMRSPRDITQDFSIFSDEFMNCKHIALEPNCYQKLDNGSVFVPLYFMLFNRSNYFVREEVLFICSTFLDNLLEDNLTSMTTPTDANIIDVCNVSTISDPDTERTRRSSHYVFENLTTTETPPSTTINYSFLSAEFLDCSSYIDFKSECYQEFDNDTVYVPSYEIVFNRSDFLIRDEILYLCSDILDKIHEGMRVMKFSEHLTYVSIPGSIISTICIALHIIMFMFVKQLRNLPGYCLLSLCFALIGAYTCLFIQNHEECAILAVFMQYFFLASFFWMNVMAYDVWKSIRMATAKLQLSRNRPFAVQFARYSCFAWGTPLMIIIISIIVHYSAPDDSKYRLIFDEHTCWFKYKRALLLYFAGPLFILLSFNISFFVSSFYMISNAAMTKSQSKNNKGSSDLWSRLLLSLRLGSVMGFMWIFGVLGNFVKQEWVSYLHELCSALQGLFIFFSFTVSERARRACMKVILKRKFSTMPTQTTSQHGSSTDRNVSSM